MAEHAKSWPWPDFHALRLRHHARARETHEQATAAAPEVAPAKPAKAPKAADAPQQDAPEGDGAGSAAQ